MIVAKDGTTYFPPKGNLDWIMAQHCRHWGGSEQGSLEEDVGRKELMVKDEWESERCELLEKEGKCKMDLEGMYMGCLKTCKVLLDDQEYFRTLFPDETETATILQPKYNLENGTSV
mmetsp:Transcript_3196/g.4302  ORF Transcript_3196/g.4302 Transcript_3196/m.4302 type:complete len:117 (-) Transcript_3196:97-447(-)